jgi:3-phosphoshikimate 1-carboxyvinyltransferase
MSDIDAAKAGQVVTAGRSGPLVGTLRLPGAALPTHLALLLASLAVGRSHLDNLSNTADSRAMAAALQSFGVRIATTGQGRWTVDGVGIGGLSEPPLVVDLEAAGSGAALLIALAASHPVTSVFSGDRPSLRSWHDLAAVLEQLGAGFVGRPGMRPPMTVIGVADPLPAIHSAADESSRLALLVAGLNTQGYTGVAGTRSSSSLLDALFGRFGASLWYDETVEGLPRTWIEGRPELVPAAVLLPGDPIAAGYLAVAAATIPGSKIVLEAVDRDQRLIALGEVLRSMGAQVSWQRVEAGSGSLHVSAAPLKAVDLSEELETELNPFIAALAVAASGASGRSSLSGWGADPSVRDTVLRGLTAAGIKATTVGATMIVDGDDDATRPGGMVLDGSEEDRVAAAFLILALAATNPVGVPLTVDFNRRIPGFVDALTALGVVISPHDH